MPQTFHTHEIARRTRAGLALCLAAAAGLAGCNVGPNYEPPKMNLPPRYSESPTTKQAVLWWQSFKDPVLNSLIERGAQSNLDVKLAEARIREARAQYGVTAAGEYPTVNADGGYTRTRISRNGTFGGAGGSSSTGTTGTGAGGTGAGGTGAGGTGAGGTGTGGTGGKGGGSSSSGTTAFGLPGNEFDLYQAGFDASWEIDVFGGVRRSTEAARADIQASVEDRRDALVTLTAEVARNYILLRGYQRQLAIAEGNLKTQRETLDVTDAKYKAGLRGQNTPSFAVNVDRAAAQVASTESSIPTLDISIRQSVHRIAVLLGQDPESLAKELLEPKAIPAVAVPEIPLGLPSDLLRRRPDIRRAERQLAAATARIGAATADLFPRFSLTGSVGFQSATFRHLPDWGSRFYSIGPAISWPIFDAGKIFSNIDVQNARTQQAYVQYQRTVLMGLEEVENALIAYNKEQVRQKALSRAVDASKRAVDLSNELYRGGLGDFLSVLDAQRDLFTSQDLLVQSERNVSANLVALYKALGGGWEDPTQQQFAPQPAIQTK